MSDRLIISISFDNIDAYLHVKNQPNSSHYIRQLVKKDMESGAKEIKKESQDIDIQNLDLDANVDSFLDW